MACIYSIQGINGSIRNIDMAVRGSIIFRDSVGSYRPIGRGGEVVSSDVRTNCMEGVEAREVDRISISAGILPSRTTKHIRGCTRVGNVGAEIDRIL